MIFLTKHFLFQEPAKKREKLSKQQSALIKKQEDLIDSAKQLINSGSGTEETSADTFGRSVSSQLKELPNLQRCIAEKIIGEVLFYAKLGELNLNTSINVNKNFQSHSRYSDHLSSEHSRPPLYQPSPSIASQHTQPYRTSQSSQYSQPYRAATSPQYSSPSPQHPLPSPLPQDFSNPGVVPSPPTQNLLMSSQYGSNLSSQPQYTLHSRSQTSPEVQSPSSMSDLPDTHRASNDNGCNQPHQISSFFREKGPEIQEYLFFKK